MTIEEKAPEKLSIDSITRQVLEAAAKRIEALSGGDAYQKAWLVATRAIRAMKPE